MPPRRLGKGAGAERRCEARLSPRRVVAVDERAEGKQRHVLADRHGDGEPARIDVQPPSRLLEDEPEDRTVRAVHGEADPPPVRAAREDLAEQRDVGVVVPEHAPVEWLLDGPRGGRDGPRGGCSYPAHTPSLSKVPEGDALHRAARALQALVGERLSVEAVHPRARAAAVAERLDGRRLESVDAQGKNLLLRFEGGRVLRSHLRMNGSWRVLPVSSETTGLPWLVLRGRERQAVLRGGSVLELTDRATRRLGPDILAEQSDFPCMVERLRRTDQSREVGEALLDQRLVSGIGNVWRAEALWEARLSPWQQLGDTSEAELLAVLGHAARLMRVSLAGRRPERRAYRRPGRPCPRCRTPILSRGQGDDNRIAYWCPTCQKKGEVSGGQ